MSNWWVAAASGITLTMGCGSLATSVSTASSASPPVASAPVVARAQASNAAASRYVDVVPVVFRDVDPSPDFPMTAPPEDVGIDRAALERLVRASEEKQSDSLLVIARGKVVVDRRFGKPSGPIALMSGTKSFVGLAIGILIAEHSIQSIDAPISTWFPEWKQGKKAKVTLREVLNHTSGLQHAQAGGVLFSQKDRLAYVRGLPLVNEPGTKFSYNNEAVELLSGVVARAAKKPLDTFVKERVLNPLGIQHFDWSKDQVGTPDASTGLALDAHDLAKVGAMLLAKGQWQGREVLPAAWTEHMVEPVSADTPYYGLLVWLLLDGPFHTQSAARRKVLEDAGFTAATKLAPLDGHRFESRGAYWMEAGALLSTEDRGALDGLIRDDRLPFETEPPRRIGYDFNGWLGQYLIVIPEADLIVVRQHREPPGGANESDNERYGMLELPSLARALVAHGPMPADKR